ncbi:mitochondrial ribonuclease P protein 3 [Fopius arisanus]|uniref:Mitochondrial ribonuclease P catalytic subunit n=1 Tax=Fopius arisanus TaxID=64838 RepID=A0A9R1U7G7_9HYME|nr:PREDICTED: mitochondrial ribonuclease P protein 3 [Fopius arisanus]
MSLFRFKPIRIALARLSSMDMPRETPINWKLPAQTRRHPDLLLHKYLQGDTKMSPEKWQEIREEMLSSKRIRITPVNIDAIILDTCCALGQDKIAREYCNYLKSQNGKFNLATTARYLKLLTDKEGPLSDNEEKDVLEVYDEIRKDYPLLDAMTAEACIRGICKTRRWREALELLKMIEENARPCGDVFRAIICASFRNNEAQIAWDFINRTSREVTPDRKVYRSFLEYSMRVAESGEELEEYLGKFFEVFADLDIYPWIDVLQEFGTALERHGWTGQQTSIRSNGVCSSCGHALQQLEVKNEDFEALFNSFVSKAIVGKDIYDKTDPQELTRFQRFIEKAKPYDVVIDGLNIEYTLWNNKTRLATGERLANVVQLLRGQGKKIVVLGRKHMYRWNREHMQYIQKYAHFFGANNTSEDDPYLLYAALAGGLKTYLVSKDLMRQHKFILSDPVLRKTFKLWLLTRQIYPITKGTPLNRMIFLLYPPSYLPVAQQDDNGWHIPAIENDIFSQESYDLSQPWYCLRKNRVENKIKQPSRPPNNYVKR